MNAASDEPIQDEDQVGAQEKTILVLEDEPDVRSFAVAALKTLGYRVCEATGVDAAMQLLEQEAENIDLLLADVVLTGNVSGPELAARAKNLYPKLKVVFMSGYTAGLYDHDRIPGFNETLLNKPFELADLAKAVQEALAA
jgi:two-component system cell cycle sensor histidine kinase/response regulator CckA